MQRDGNLVLYQHGVGALWHTGTHDTFARVAIMQHDGNFVVYDAAFARAYWHTGTHGNPGAFLAVQDDANLVVYTSGGRPLWDRHDGRLD